MEEGEFNKMVDYYNDLGMTEEMIDEDDLLDDIVVPETQGEEPHSGYEQIEAIAQLGRKEIPRAQETAVRPNKEDKSPINPPKEDQSRQKPQKCLLKVHGKGGKTVTPQSPDTKGTAASRKLDARGRMSPKSKAMNPARPLISTSQTMKQLPRYEVYPSALKGGKQVSLPGSVVSQKPPSKRI
ncbi:Uncharacterized protein Rs2_40165 [Raphanus sativus]|nr:Uncharacterized protein Rs2_40165 [Raphanus sativus]